MKLPWNGLYDSTKDRRYGTLFLLAFILAGGALLISVKLWAGDMPGRQVAGPFLLAVGGVMAWRIIMKLAGRRRVAEPTDLARLSSDEIAKARSKLRKG
jgi:hypothetical protein